MSDGLIDLHSHTNESDGTSSPAELIAEAAAAGVDTLAITDHDTFAAHAVASSVAAEAGIRLIRGIELTCKQDGRNVHLLGYFFLGPANSSFDEWLAGLLEARGDRNRRLAKRLQDLGLDVALEDAEKFGRSLTGRPHFARALIEKGHVATIREAFDRYLGETGTAFVEREAPPVEIAIEKIRGAGGVASLAHPIRLITNSSEEAAVRQFADAGLNAIEAYHTDQTAVDVARYLAMAEKFGLSITGGSDYHGTHKPGARLGHCMTGTQAIPTWIRDRWLS